MTYKCHNSDCGASWGPASAPLVCPSCGGPGVNVDAIQFLNRELKPWVFVGAEPLAMTLTGLMQGCREEGRRDILREIAAMDPRTEADGRIVCYFCDADLEGRPKGDEKGHAIICLWLKAKGWTFEAQALKRSEDTTTDPA